MALVVGQISPASSGADALALPSSTVVDAVLKNVGEVAIYLGSTSGFALADGYPLEPGEVFTYSPTEGISIYLRPVSGTGRLAYFYAS